MSLIAGNNLTLNAAELVSVPSQLFLRSITADSTDTLDTATNFVQNYIGVVDPNFNGYSFTFSIYNTSTSYSITLNLGTGMAINPDFSNLNVDTIPPDSSRIYTFVQTSAELDVSATLAVYPH